MRRVLPNQNIARICVIGVGRSGGLVVNQLQQRGQGNASFLSLQSDATAFTQSTVQNTLLIGDTLLRGAGTNGDPRLGAEALKSSGLALQQTLRGVQIIIMVAGLGGGTGSGAAPLVAQLAKSMGILTIAVATTPFPFESQKRKAVAGAGLRALHRYVDTVLTIDNDRMLKLDGGHPADADAEHPAIDIITECLATIGDFLCPHGILTVDVADLKEIMSVGGSAFIARGKATGENRAEKAAEQATISRKLGASIAEAKGVLVQIRGGRDLSLLEVEAAAAYVRNQMDGNIEFTMGAVMDPELGPELQVSLIATGMQRELPYIPMPAEEPAQEPEARRRETGRYNHPPMLRRAYLT